MISITALHFNKLFCFLFFLPFAIQINSLQKNLQILMTSMFATGPQELEILDVEEIFSAHLYLSVSRCEVD